MQGCAIVLGTTSNNIQHTRASKTQIRLKERKTNDKKKKIKQHKCTWYILIYISLSRTSFSDFRPTTDRHKSELRPEALRLRAFEGSAGRARDGRPYRVSTTVVPT